MESIFVQIATYHDYELPNTIADLIENSSGNNIINFGIYLCYYEKEDITIPNLPNIKYKTDMAPEGIGLGYSRLMAHNFYNGEDYYLQIDSHTKMNKNWDEQIIADIKYYQSLGINKPLLTTYPRNYSYQESGVVFDKNNRVTQISFDENVNQFNAIGIPTQTAVGNEEQNIFSNSVSGGSIFTVGDFIKPNPRIAFYGEEIMIAARAFTNGFDLMLPRNQYMYHLYFDHSRPTESKRRLLWKDFPEEFEKIDKISKQEILNIFNNNIVGEEELGKERTLDEFGTFAGLDFKNMLVVKNKCML
jgi:hypothetical protein